MPSLTSPPLTLTGEFYPAYKAANPGFEEATFACAERAVGRILETATSSEHPGMLLGKVQSGKTRTFISILALAFDNGFDIAIVLTKNSRPLVEQTYKRLRSEFKPFIEEEEIEIYDIMHAPETFTVFELDSKLIFVAKKQKDNLTRLQRLFAETCPAMGEKRVLIIDDEADNASIGYAKRGDLIDATTIAGQISDFRSILGQSSFLQVTATPYSLYLQPTEIVVDNIADFKPTRPAFTELVPVPDTYVGGDTYFGDAARGDEDTIQSLIHYAVDHREFDRLKRRDGRWYHPEEVLTTHLLGGFRHAIVTFIVGGVIQRINGVNGGQRPKKIRHSFLLHSEAARGSHEWQVELTQHLVDQFCHAAEIDAPVFTDLVAVSHQDLARSLTLDGKSVPALADVVAEVRSAMAGGHVTISKVNSDEDVSALLDESGQLRLRSPLCIFIGGQVLDRGVTLANLIGFYYGRRPNRYQQDTVLQHSRMFGYRRADLAVTRFYTSMAIRLAMFDMEEFDVSLRSAIESGGDNSVQFIRRAADGRIVPCSPNKILISNIEILRPYKRLLPVGFQSGYKTRIEPIIRKIDEKIQPLIPTDDPARAFLIPLDLALEIIHLAYEALEFEEDFPNNEPALAAALAHLSSNSVDPDLRQQVWCVYRGQRTVVRVREGGRFTNAPDSQHRAEGAVVREAAQTIPALTLLRQEGRKDEDGWRGTPFYWPVVLAPARTHTAVFASQVIED